MTAAGYRLTKKMNATDITDELFKLLSEDAGVRAAITGGVYADKRPEGRLDKTDIVIISNFVRHQPGAPATGLTNVNIHVPDLTVKIGGRQQPMPDRDTIRSATDAVLAAVRDAYIEGASIWTGEETVIDEPDLNGHYANIRINWFIERI